MKWNAITASVQKLLRKPVGEASEAAHASAHREVLAFDVAG
jgi:hypothetical protein